jgi:hypothetical protein
LDLKSSKWDCIEGDFGYFWVLDGLPLAAKMTTTGEINKVNFNDRVILNAFFWSFN